MFSNLLADFVVRLNLGAQNRVEHVIVPYSIMTLRLTRLLIEQGCVNSFFIVRDSDKSCLLIKVKMKYIHGKSAMARVNLISKPGLRRYWTADELFKHFSKNMFQGFYVVSTSAGLCTSSEVLLLRGLKRRVSGEVLLKIFF